MNSKKMYEVLKCAKDPLYFAENYYTSMSIDKGLVKGSPLYADQKLVLELMQHNSRVMGLTARQTGMTRLSNMYALWDGIFNQDRTIGIVCPKSQTGYQSIANIILAYDQLPRYMKPAMTKMTNDEIGFDNGSTIFARSPSAPAFRGITVNTLMVSDVAFMNNQSYEDMKNVIFPVISSAPSGKIFMWSAPHGNNFFKTEYDRAKASNVWANFELPWTTIPTRGKKWKDKMISCLGEDAFKTEYMCEFR